MFMKFNSANSHGYIMASKRIIYFCFFFLSPVKLWTPIAEALWFLSSFIHFNNLRSSFFASLKGLSNYFLSKNKAVIHLTIYNVSFVFLYLFFVVIIWPEDSMKEMRFELITCIHGFIQFILKNSYKLRLTNYRYSIFKERSMLNIKTWRDICKLLYSDHFAYFVL